VRPQIGFDCMVFLKIGRPSEGLKDPKHWVLPQLSLSLSLFSASVRVAIGALSGGIILC
jgi:hypothetical protein